MSKTTKRPLTRRQAETLIFISNFIQDMNCAPTVREVARYFRIGKKTARKHFQALRKKGYVILHEDHLEITEGVPILEERNDIYIYEIRNVVNEKRYIGQTDRPKARWYQHVNDKSGSPIVNAIKKYGQDSFEMTILIDGLSQEDANNLEILFIDLCNTLTPNGYNMNLGPIPYNKGEKLPAELQEELNEGYEAIKASQNGALSKYPNLTDKVITEFAEYQTKRAKYPNLKIHTITEEGEYYIITDPKEKTWSTEWLTEFKKFQKQREIEFEQKRKAHLEQVVARMKGML